MREKSQETIVVRPNEIRLVRRPDSDRWQAHYKVEAIGRWLRKATLRPFLGYRAPLCGLDPFPRTV